MVDPSAPQGESPRIRPENPTVPIPEPAEVREFDAEYGSERNRSGFDPTAPRPGASEPTLRAAGAIVEDSEIPGTVGFIQPGWYYTDDEGSQFVYVMRDYGDGGVDGRMGKSNYLETSVLGPTGAEDRQLHNSRSAMARWATKRMTRAEVPTTFAPNAGVLREREYQRDKAERDRFNKRLQTDAGVPSS